MTSWAYPALYMELQLLLTNNLRSAIGLCHLRTKWPYHEPDKKWLVRASCRLEAGLPTTLEFCLSCAVGCCCTNLLHFTRNHLRHTRSADEYIACLHTLSGWRATVCQLCAWLHSRKCSAWTHRDLPLLPVTRVRRYEHIKYNLLNLFTSRRAGDSRVASATGTSLVHVQHPCHNGSVAVRSGQVQRRIKQFFSTVRGALAG